MFSQIALNESVLFEKLHQFSESNFWLNLNAEEEKLFGELNYYQEHLNFPAVKNDVGQIINFFVSLRKPKKIFEFGSGYGHSAFWYFTGKNTSIERVVLTEKRTDLEPLFYKLPWPKDWLDKMTYLQKDAFLALEQESDLDFILIDGQKSLYLDFIKLALEKLNPNGLIFIDNAFIKGGFLVPENENKQVVIKIKELFEFIKKSNLKRVFLPVTDGLIVLQKI